MLKWLLALKLLLEYVIFNFKFSSGDLHTIDLVQVQFEGEASDGGFAIDDIAYYEGTCHSKF